MSNIKPKHTTAVLLGIIFKAKANLQTAEGRCWQITSPPYTLQVRVPFY